MLALDRSKPLPKRIAALRGIAALGPAAEQSSIGLHVLLTSNEPEIKKQADITLTAVRDPIVIEHLAKACQPRAPKFDFLALESLQCLSEIAEFGPAGSAAAAALMPFLQSENQAERDYGILTLGYISYSPAIGKIDEALDSKDWRVVYAAVRGVGWLGDRNHHVAELLRRQHDRLFTPHLEQPGAHGALRVARRIRQTCLDLANYFWPL